MSSGILAESEPTPQLIWETFNAYQRTAALRAAIELDLFRPAVKVRRRPKL